jgi:nucleotide-binding universal stress UspA family protein
MRLILVPLDSSPFAERALPAALDLARRHHAQVVLIAVHQPVLPIRGGQGAMVFDQRYEADMRRTLSEYLDVTAAAIAADDPTIAVRVELLEGSPVSVISEFAHRHAADLIVITSHGRGGPARWVMGSVADGLVRTVPTPVLIVRVDESSTESMTTSVKPPFQRVVIALDGSSESESAIARATRIVHNDRATFTLLYVSPPLHPVLRLLANAEELKHAAEHQQAAARQYLSEAVARNRALGSISSALTVDLHPARGVTEFAASHQADLIVLSTHGRGPIGRTFLGSIADKVVRTASIPVLLCHAPRPDEESGAEPPG